MQIRRIKLISAAVLGLVLTLAIALPTLSWAQATPTQTCAYDPSSGQPNPLGMRSFITATELDGNTIFQFDQFPSPVAGDRPGVTIGSRRELTFYGVGVAEARRLLRDNLSYYSALIGEDVNEGFAAVDDVMVCRSGPSTQMPRPLTPVSSPAASPVPSPAASPMTLPTQALIASLPNGVYRYWSGQPASPNATVTDEELLQSGGALFLFRKTENQIVGNFGYIDNVGICVQGTINGNTVSGQAFPYDRAITNTGENFSPWGSADFLQVRRGVQAGSQSRYNSALLNLSSFSRINAGTRQPPRSCT